MGGDSSRRAVFQSLGDGRRGRTFGPEFDPPFGDISCFFSGWDPGYISPYRQASFPRPIGKNKTLKIIEHYTERQKDRLAVYF